MSIFQIIKNHELFSAYGCVLQEEKDRNQRNPIDDLETKYLKKRQKKNDMYEIICLFYENYVPVQL